MQTTKVCEYPFKQNPSLHWLQQTDQGKGLGPEGPLLFDPLGHRSLEDPRLFSYKPCRVKGHFFGKVMADAREKKACTWKGPKLLLLTVSREISIPSSEL